ncbi:hypothetical protein PUR71_37980 [Streptomyces sp. SP17BM10]|uniref:hypothetical protein n=1 Tax=Streptomyces sp. SP17BM10 TaxID=3002530 RepID=UPI002E77ACC2|nr:hypothetical protein [Streptomyces sp. SP17BM10]MEE1788652.1 hypothetical protein [Streptomyces sp. SP17BM10]
MRAGFLPLPVYEADPASCLHLVRAGRATSLCRATFPPTSGIVTVPLAPPELSWRHVIGWAPHSLAWGLADEVVGHAKAVHADAAALNPAYATWLRRRTRSAP